MPKRRYPKPKYNSKVGTPVQEPSRFIANAKSMRTEKLPTANGPTSRGVINLDYNLIAIAACFFLSGFAALVYQAAWLRQLGVVFGTSHIAVATVLAAYMAGLATGAAIAARFIDRIQRPVLVYGILELTIGVSALLVPTLLSAAQQLLVWLYGHQAVPAEANGTAQSVFYLIATFLIFAVPTGAMGATLPLLTRHAVH